MVEALLGRIKHSANVADNVKLVEDLLVPCPHDDCILVFLSVHEHGSSEHLVTMENLTVSSDDFDALSLLNSTFNIVQGFNVFSSNNP